MKNQFKSIEEFEEEHPKAIAFLEIKTWNVERVQQINRKYYFLNKNIYFIYQKVWKGTWYIEKTYPNHIKIYIDSNRNKMNRLMNIATYSYKFLV